MENENEIYKGIIDAGERQINKDSTASDPIFDETRVTGAIVFKGSVQLLSQLLYLIQNKGEVIYHKVTSPDQKLWISDKNPNDKIW